MQILKSIVKVAQQTEQQMIYFKLIIQIKCLIVA